MATGLTEVNEVRNLEMRILSWIIQMDQSNHKSLQVEQKAEWVRDVIKEEEAGEVQCVKRDSTH